MKYMVLKESRAAPNAAISIETVEQFNEIISKTDDKLTLAIFTNDDYKQLL